jgi:hypothetical protein
LLTLDPSALCAGVHSLANPLPDLCLDVIDTDRPHQTDTPHVVAAGHTQVESALASVQLSSGPAHLVFVEDNYKFGLVTGVDLQLLVKHVDYVPAARALAPPGPFGVRVKINVVEEKGAVPAVTLVPWGFFPAARSQPLRGGPLVFWGWELPAGFELEMNAGVLFAAHTPEARVQKPPAAVVLASALTKTVFSPRPEVRVFVDVYATGWDIALGTGALWAFMRDMQFDLGTYIGLSGDEPTATPFVGFSVRR